MATQKQTFVKFSEEGELISLDLASLNDGLVTGVKTINLEELTEEEIQLIKDCNELIESKAIIIE